MEKRCPPWLYAIIYTGASLGAEIVLIVVFRLEIPRDNGIIAPLILTIPPLLAARVAGYRSGRGLFLLALLTSALTLAVTLTVTHFTGVSTGLREPLINRPVAAFLAAVMANHLLKKRGG